MSIVLEINGKRRSVEADAEKPLLWVLREDFGLLGTKFGCGQALCGACTVHIDGQPARACQTPIGSVGNSKVTTIEAVGLSAMGKRVSEAWIELDVPQCGYCQAGQIMSAVALLEVTPNPSDSDIDGAMAGNLCRCGTYHRIRDAIHKAAGARA